jgi:hypothetical protein
MPSKFEAQVSRRRTACSSNVITPACPTSIPISINS